MTRFRRAFLLLLAGLGGVAHQAAEARSRHDVEVGAEVRAFAHTGLQGQEQVHPSLRVRYDWFSDEVGGENDQLQVVVHGRADAHDDERTHLDLREFDWIHVGEDWELRAGVRKVFWGVTEGVHLVDILNQTDLVENLDGEDKLGQPMLNLSAVRDWGILDFYVMPGFRTRTFPGREGRLRTPVVVDTDHPEFESGARRQRVDFAMRWAHTLGDADIGLAHFSGTGRDPVLDPRVTVTGPPPFPPLVTLDLIPVYYVIDQTSLDLQYVWEDWAFKLEALTRSGEPGGRYSAFAAGFEHTRVGILGSRIDLGWIVEHYRDDRGDSSPGFQEHDWLLATRWAMNDVAGSEILAGMFWDPHSEERIFSLEGSRRLGANWKLLVEARWFSGGHRAPRGDAAALAAALAADPDRKLQFVEDDDLLQVELVRYF